MVVPVCLTDFVDLTCVKVYISKPKRRVFKGILFNEFGRHDDPMRLLNSSYFTRRLMQVPMLGAHGI